MRTRHWIWPTVDPNRTTSAIWAFAQGGRFQRPPPPKKKIWFRFFAFLTIEFQYSIWVFIDFLHCQRVRTRRWCREFFRHNIWVLWTVEAVGPNLRLTRIRLKRSVKRQSDSTTCGIMFCPCPWSHCPPSVKWRQQAPTELRYSSTIDHVFAVTTVKTELILSVRVLRSCCVVLCYEHDDHRFLQPQQSLLDFFFGHNAKFTVWLCCVVLRAWWLSFSSASAVVARFFLRPEREIYKDHSSRGLSRLLCIRREYVYQYSTLGQLNDSQLLKRGFVSGSPWSIDVRFKNGRSRQNNCFAYI